MSRMRLILVDDITGKRYEKNEEGIWSKVMSPDPSGRCWRKHVERHTFAPLNQLLLRMVIAEKVETPTKSPVSFGEYKNAKGDKYMPLNIVQSNRDTEGIAIFSKDRNPIGTISLKSFDHLIIRLIQYRNEWVLWKEKEKEKEETEKQMEREKENGQEEK